MRILLLLLSVMLLLPMFIGCSGTRPRDLGVRDGKLLPCPSSPNCVSSQSTDADHAVEPLGYSGSQQEAMTRISDIVRGMPRTTIITESGGYLHAEFRSLLFRFVDDVEFTADDRQKLIHLRSASRLGRSDLGVNRKRIERIRTEWTRKH